MQAQIRMKTVVCGILIFIAIAAVVALAAFEFGYCTGDSSKTTDVVVGNPYTTRASCILDAQLFAAGTCATKPNVTAAHTTWLGSIVCDCDFCSSTCVQLAPTPCSPGK